MPWPPRADAHELPAGALVPAVRHLAMIAVADPAADETRSLGPAGMLFGRLVRDTSEPPFIRLSPWPDELLDLFHERLRGFEPAGLATLTP